MDTSIRLTKHAAKQAIERNITPEKAAKALSEGRHYIDLISKSRVVWDKGRDIALIIAEKEDTIITIYNDINWSKIIRWAVSNWKW